MRVILKGALRGLAIVVVAAILVVGIFAALEAGGYKISKTAYAASNCPFVTLYWNNNWGYQVCYHKDTGVCYIISYKGGSSMMRDQDGNPYIYEDWAKGE